MAKAQVIIDVHNPTEAAALDAWLEVNQSRLTFMSENSGCGCCVNIYDIEGPEEVLGTIPPDILGWADEPQ